MSFQTKAQYYVRGEVKNESNEALQNVKIYQLSTHLLFYTGTSGGFGIVSPTLNDSLTFTVEGYQPKMINVKCTQYQQIVLRALSNSAIPNKQTLISITRDLKGNSRTKSFFGEESYSSLIENDFIPAIKFSNTGFAVRIDKASYSNIRRFLNQNTEVPTDAVRIDEMLNYFNLNYVPPGDNEVFHLESQLSDCPWNSQHQLLYINMNARKLSLDKIPASNFVFLIDVSGSMDMPNRLPLLKAAFQLLVKNLRAKDTVSIVIYGGSVGLWLPPTGGSEQQKILKSIEELDPSGSTPGEAAIRLAYKVAESSFIKGGNNRIILATDGDFNVGQTNEKDLEELISKERKSGVYLTCLGVGMGNYKDSKIEALAKKGNGNFAYLDDIREAEKVLITEFTQNLYTVANDVYLNTKFNPEMVKEYRLIGYDNNKNITSDQNSELEGGEIGSGNGITAIFEILFIAPLSLKLNDVKKDIGIITLNYRLPNEKRQLKLVYHCLNNYTNINELKPDLRFAAALTEFGLLLRKSAYCSQASWNNIEMIARGTVVSANYLQSEFITLVVKARKIYTKKKKKKDIM